MVGGSESVGTVGFSRQLRDKLLSYQFVRGLEHHGEIQFVATRHGTAEKPFSPQLVNTLLLLLPWYAKSEESPSLLVFPIFKTIIIGNITIIRVF